MSDNPYIARRSTLIRQNQEKKSMLSKEAMESDMMVHIVRTLGLWRERQDDQEIKAILSYR